MSQTAIEDHATCKWFKKCRNTKLSPGPGKYSLKFCKETAEYHGLPCYEDNQSACSQFQHYEMTGGKIQLRLPGSMRKGKELKPETQHVKPKYNFDPMVA